MGEKEIGEISKKALAGGGVFDSFRAPSRGGAANRSDANAPAMGKLKKVQNSR